MRMAADRSAIPGVHQAVHLLAIDDQLVAKAQAYPNPLIPKD